ncbi:MAG: trimethylamine methyltransferase family protein [Deltaproteobacteria bacterium]|nr:trimethylamine methyltransferase family protein [Deltaproteobacteria bacterium]
MKRRFRSGISSSSGLGLSSFSRDELDSIHYATLQILQDSGIKVMNEKALEVFHGGGAKVERHEGFGIVRIPSFLVEDAAYTAPHTLVFDARNPADDYIVEPNRVGFTTFGGCINIVDPHTREIRRATKKDCGNLIRVCDALDEISVAVRAVNSTDVMEQAQSVHNLDAIISNTGKHIFIGADSVRNLQVMVDLASASVGGREVFEKRPIFTASVCPLSPLTLGENTCDVIMECAALGLGILILPMALSGGTASASLAGTLVTHNAEVLATIVLAQLMKKGMPCTYGSTSTILDLRFGTSAIGSARLGGRRCIGQQGAGYPIRLRVYPECDLERTFRRQYHLRIRCPGTGTDHGLCQADHGCGDDQNDSNRTWGRCHQRRNPGHGCHTRGRSRRRLYFPRTQSAQHEKPIPGQPVRPTLTG